MICGMGLDLVGIMRIQANIDRYGRRFADKILHQDEMQDYLASARPAGFLARRFAAKEAMVKALGTGLRHGISLKNIAVRHGTDGQPYLVCNGKILELMDARGIHSSHLSITDEQDYACACVILEKNSP